MFWSPQHFSTAAANIRRAGDTHHHIALHGSFICCAFCDHLSRARTSFLVCVYLCMYALCQRQFHFGARLFAVAPAPYPSLLWYLVLMVRHLYLSFNVQAMYIFGPLAIFLLDIRPDVLLGYMHLMMAFQTLFGIKSCVECINLA